MAFVSETQLRWSIRRLRAWGVAVRSQSRPHIWSLLPAKLKGASPGERCRYSEADDRAFFERFLRYKDDHFPYFDPTSATWLTETYWHSNAATFRKNRFAKAWGAASWDGETLILARNYADVYTDKVLTKGRVTVKMPALPLAIFFFKRPESEWPEILGDVRGIRSMEQLLEMFGTQFNFSNEERSALFDWRIEDEALGDE